MESVVSQSLMVNTRYVDASATGASTGLSWTDAFTNVQDALSVAIAGDEIWIAAGVYYPDEGMGQINNAISSTFTISNSVNLYGGFNGTESNLNERDYLSNFTVLSGDLEQNDWTDPIGVVTQSENIVGSNAYHVIVSHNRTTAALIDGLWITGGSANDRISYGGGLYNTGFAIINNVKFYGNLAGSSGGGIANVGGLLGLNNVTFSGNHAGIGGGGLANFAYSSATLTDVVFVNNHAAGGGGISNGAKSSVNLTNVFFFDNQAAVGGGLENDYYGSASLKNVIFAGNYARGSGGGLYNGEESGAHLTNVVFSGNYAEYSGGGMKSDFGAFWLTNTTFTGNRAGGSGGGMHVSDAPEHSGPSITNSVFWRNMDASGIGTAQSSISHWNFADAPTNIQNSDVQGCGGSKNWNASCMIDGGRNIDADPQFMNMIHPMDAPTTSGDFHLLTSSPAIAAGNLESCPATDLEGNPRPINSPCDMGAYEFSGLAFRKSANFIAVEPGQIVSFTLTVVNDLNITTTGGIISDVLPAELNFIGPIELEPAGAGNVGSLPPVLVSDLTLTPTQTVTLTFPVSIAQNLPKGTKITNIAQIRPSDGAEILSSSVIIFIPWEFYLPIIVR
jgi:uncharacterized repeat protein (TIGR01451 family)